MNNLYGLNKLLIVIIIVVTALALISWWRLPNHNRPLALEETPLKLPENPYHFNSETYETMVEKVLPLEEGAYAAKFPDLSSEMIFYGINKRPDATVREPLLNFGIQGSSRIASVIRGERLYLSISDEGYIFSPNNEPSPLWIESDLTGSHAFVKLGVEMPSYEDTQYMDFELAPKNIKQERARVNFAIGSHRADAGLLARQRARWQGGDVFLEAHGGAEYAGLQGLQRIDFDAENGGYKVFIGSGKGLVWKDGRWHTETIGKDTQGFPLLLINKFDERTMKLDLWDPSGSFKIPLNLVKSREMWTPELLEQEFKFVGAKTHKQAIVEIEGERVLLKPHDWLLHIDQGWKKLTTEEEIDDYVTGVEEGELLVVEGIEKKDGHQYLAGILYSPGRGQSHNILLPLQSMVQADIDHEAPFEVAAGRYYYKDKTSKTITKYRSYPVHRE
ncbi:MAG: hypothetical protein ACQEP8_03810 [Chlamydiota bacterium]